MISGLNIEKSVCNLHGSKTILVTNSIVEPGETGNNIR
jgi:hypothetical protein